MRSFIFLSAILVTVIFLTVHYSFWVAFGIIYFGGMLVVTVLSFAIESKPL
jgi:hypothetical protein